MKIKTVVSVFTPVELPVIDNGELAIELDVDTIAKKAARQGIPRSTAKEPDANELNFQSKLKTKMIQAKHRSEEAIGYLKDFYFSN
ncbi:MAG: hypothetical protein Q9M91_06855 [Candidatus Dojkabacteria bacterium]|nr:hypothetical protein [Candidatus Dojkabacteria bacterium]